MPQDVNAIMVFAAGFGTRMGELTRAQPKPLIRVNDAALLDHALDLADAAGIGRIVVNTHYLADQIVRHLGTRPDIALSHEADEILETGGGLKQALPLLGRGPVLTLNSDAVWTGQNPLIQLLQAWDPAEMDALLLLLPAPLTRGHRGTGDFVMDQAGRIRRAGGQPGLTYLGAQILKTDGLSAIPDRVFSLNRLWDQAIAEGRAFGLVHNGLWCDVGHPGGIAEAEQMLAEADG
ncbi:nucleotidyltransferase family protein [Aliigemmobacter aestuarii]|uniref:Nucleotidyltransferase family protein n=1 Tax=Aliigemmobacter aestuarii TaxID=1445661 RepID=A0A4S3MU31_9RHOB|nr:nucleotidyltransferase family protein [Gemmobacter aestuarii]THD85673.1 nucleotidyltransferase family protein [Gemmobacter aestuarii]